MAGGRLYPGGDGFRARMRRMSRSSAVVAVEADEQRAAH